MTASTGDDQLVVSLVDQLRAMRDAERDIFGALEPAVRDRPIRPGDWSPKDHQAHLTAWKAILRDRLRATVKGETLVADGREEDVRNAELQALRADWAWEDVVREADEVNDQLQAEIRAAGVALIVESEGMIGRIFGNSAPHAMTHFAWLADAGIGVDPARIAAFVDQHEHQLEATPLPAPDRAIAVYNLACAHAVAGRLDRARPLLAEAFALRPDLAEFAKGDPDLVELRAELG